MYTLWHSFSVSPHQLPATAEDLEEAIEAAEAEADAIMCDNEDVVDHFHVRQEKVVEQQGMSPKQGQGQGQEKEGGQGWVWINLGQERGGGQG